MLTRQRFLLNSGNLYQSVNKLNRAVTKKTKTMTLSFPRNEGEGGRTASFRVDGNTGEKLLRLQGMLMC